jgi:putative spermidine/putrescine transport system substrate-binding protein
MKPSAFLLLTLFAAGCRSTNRPTQKLSVAEFGAADWEDVVSKARGTEVVFAMWAGDESRNRVFRNEISKHLEAKFGITLRIVPLGATTEGINKLLNEKAAGKTAGGSIDFIWINGENFRTAKQGGLLWGPFCDRLPNIKLYDTAVRQRDFGTPIDGFEAPWQKAQFVLAYDSARLPKPPGSIPELQAWIKAHPGRFTYIAPPDFTGSVFVRHLLLHFGAHDARFWSGFDEDLYRRASAETIRYLNQVKPSLWRRGETYPPSPMELNRLFANNEVDFAMSYGPAFASVLISRGEFPSTARTFVFEEGTIGNYNFLAIPFNASNLPGALVTINELMSFEQMMTLCRGVDDLFPHRLEALTKEERERMNSLPQGAATLPIEVLEKHFMPEPDAEYLNRLDKDWRAKVLQQ